MFNDVTCDRDKLVFIRSHEKTVAVCLLTVRVTLLMEYLYDNMAGHWLCVKRQYV